MKKKKPPEEGAPPEAPKERKRKAAPKEEASPDIAAFEAALERVAEKPETRRVGDSVMAPQPPVQMPFGLRDFFAEFDAAPNEFLALTENELKKQGRAERFTQKKIEDYLTFTLAREVYGVPISRVREIIKPQPLTPVPRMPPWVSGILSLRGSIVPVFSLSTRLGLGAGEAQRSTRIVVFEDAEELVGFYVDEVREVVRLPLHAVEPPPSWKGSQHQDIIRGVGRIDSLMIILLEFDSLVAHLRAA